MSRFRRGVLITLCAAILWGGSGGAAQFLFEHYDTSAAFLTAVRLPVAGLVILGVVVARQPQRLRALLRNREALAGVVVFGVVGLFASQITYLLAVEATSAGTATVLQQVCCVLVMLYVCVRDRHAPHPAELAALVCAMAATYVISTGGDPSALNIPAHGIFWGLLSALTVAFYLVQPQALMRKWGSLLVTGAGMLAGGIVAVPLFVLVRAVGPSLGLPEAWVAVPQLDAFGWLMLVVFVLLGTVVAYSMFLHGVSIVGGVVGGLLGCAEPVSASLFSFLLLGTAYGWADWLGLVLILACVALVTLAPAPPRTIDDESAGEEALEGRKATSEPALTSAPDQIAHKEE